MKLKEPLFAIALAATALLSANASAHEPKVPAQDMKGHDMSKTQGHYMKGHSAGSMELHQIMTSGMKMSMPMSGNVDKDFATMMTMHHQQAVKMADVLIKHGRSTELKALARRMKAAQQAEIKQMAPHTK